MTSKTLFSLMLLSLLLVSCTPYAPSFFPLRKGAHWEYKTKGAILQKRVVSLTEKKGEEQAELLWENDGRELTRERYRVNLQGIFLLANRFFGATAEAQFIPPKPLLLFQKKNSRWVWRGKVLTPQGSLPGEARFTSRYPLRIRIGRRDYTAAQVTEAMTLFFSDGKESVWQRYTFSPGHGLVRFENQVPRSPRFVAELVE